MSSSNQIAPAPDIAAPARPAYTGTVYKWMQASAVCVVLILMAGILHMGESASYAFALAGGFLMHMAAGRPSAREALATAACGAVFSAVYILLNGSFGHFFGSAIGIAGGFLGMGSIMVLAAKWIWALPEDKRAHFEPLCDVSLLALLCVGSMIALSLGMQWTPLTYDRVLYVFDAKFGSPPSWIIGKMLLAHPGLRAICGCAYDGLPVVMAACLAIQWRDRAKGIRAGVDLRWAVVALGIAGFVLYQICPAAGPVHLFGEQFPREIPDMTGMAIGPSWLKMVPRNAMPSLHVGWMLLLFWNVRRRGWWIGASAAVYLILTVLATLGLGEHYLVDLVVAAPFALAVQAGCTRGNRPERWIALAIGAAVSLAWIIGLRTGAMMAVPAGAAIWIASGLTVGLSAAAAWRLEHAASIA